MLSSKELPLKLAAQGRAWEPSGGPLESDEGGGCDEARQQRQRR
jgi:hypothetical protein